jgi:hypothetical protein
MDKQEPSMSRYFIYEREITIPAGESESGIINIQDSAIAGIRTDANICNGCGVYFADAMESTSTFNDIYDVHNNLIGIKDIERSRRYSFGYDSIRCIKFVKAKTSDAQKTETTITLLLVRSDK